MPKMINQETGEEKEISMEEFLRAMQNGSVSIRQEVHHADGTVTGSMIYGDTANDGIDRSVNIFGKLEDVLRALILKAKKAKEEDESAEIIFEMECPDTGYEIVVDDMEHPLMHIVTCTKESIKVSRYIRDERKSVGKPISESEFPFKDGKLKATLDEAREDNALLLIAFGVNEDRNLLAERGQLQELQALGNRSSGVVFSSNEEEVFTKIVRGHNRPDLPCLLFGGMFGQGIEDAEMMRPYMDELMGDALHAGMSLEEKIEAAEEGDPDLMEELAKAYLDGDGVETDFEKAVYWFKKLADTGNSVAMFNLGLHYAKGCGVERDFDKAAEWMRKAAEAGDEDGEGIAKSYAEIKENIKKAEAGDATAQAELASTYMQMAGSLYQAGPGDDYKEAYKWAKKSADQGNLDGLYALGLCYSHGRGVAEDDRAAVNTYWKAAQKGHAPSQWNLAVCYLNGEGCERDLKKGYEWAYMAYDQGYQLAVDGLTQQGKTIPQIIERYNDNDYDVAVEGTQYEGRADRCERLRAGAEIKAVRAKNNSYDENAIEFFYNGGSIGLMPRWDSETIAPFMDMGRLEVAAVVKSCIPKSQRGKRARNADVHLKLKLKEIKPETPEEKAKRLEAERIEAERKAEAARKAAEEKRRREEEAKKKAEEALRAWEAEVASIKEKREADWNAFISQAEKKLENNKAEIQARSDADLSSVKTQMEKAEADIKEANAELSTLGVFKFSRKKELKAMIESLEGNLSALRSEPAKLEERCKQEIQRADRDHEAGKTAYKADLDKKYALPPKPGK